MPRHRLYKTDDCSPPYELVKVNRTGERPIPAEYRDRIFIHTVHDGDTIPKPFIKPGIDRKALLQHYIMDRDWGANLVAHRIASAMGLSGYGRCSLVFSSISTAFREVHPTRMGSTLWRA